MDETDEVFLFGAHGMPQGSGSRSGISPQLPQQEGKLLEEDPTSLGYNWLLGLTGFKVKKSTYCFHCGIKKKKYTVHVLLTYRNIGRNYWHVKLLHLVSLPTLCRLDLFCPGLPRCVDPQVGNHWSTRRGAPRTPTMPPPRPPLKKSKYSRSTSEVCKTKNVNILSNGNLYVM